MVPDNLLAGFGLAADAVPQGDEVLLSLVRSREKPSGPTEEDNEGHGGTALGLGRKQHFTEPQREPSSRRPSFFAVSHGGQEHGEVDPEAILTGKGDGRDGPRMAEIPVEEGTPYGKFEQGPLKGLPIFSAHKYPDPAITEVELVHKGGKRGNSGKGALLHDHGIPHGDPLGVREGDQGLKRKGEGEGEDFSFPPSPPKARKGIFTGWSTPESPLRSLIRPAMRFIRNSLEGKGRPREQEVKKVPSLGGKSREKGKKRTGFKAALVVAQEVKKSSNALREFDDQFSSSSSRAPKESRRKLVKEILETFSGKGQALPLTSKTFKYLGAVLWKANYKSAELYLVEAKLMHVEMGYDWTSQLDLMMKRCKRGAARDRGPRNKAPEVDKARRLKMKKTTLPRGVKVLYPKELFTFAMVWMLREAELSKFSREDITIKEDKKYVQLRWRKSKMDQKGFGVTRVLACLCDGAVCESECPFRVSKDLLQKVKVADPNSKSLCLLRGAKEKASKGQIVKAWSTAYSMKVTGHSARRSGALNYIRNGWTIPQVAYLGRWSSSIIYSYAQEALETLPVNSRNQHFGPTAQMAFDENGRIAEAKSHVESLELEIAEFKRDSKNTLKVLKKEVDDLNKNFGTKRDGPPRVQGLQSGLVHENNTPITSVPPLYWRTKCGWSFKYGNFCFVPAEKPVTCSKCLGGLQPALSQGGDLGSL